MKTVIMGSGNGAIALAAWQSYCKHDVTICSLKGYDDNFTDFIDSKQIIIKGALKRNISLSNVTNDVRCVENADVVCIVVPSFAHKNIFQNIVPHLRDGQIIIVFTGNFASVTLREILENSNSSLKLNVVETDSLPFACRYEGNAVINIMGIKKCLSAGIHKFNNLDRQADRQIIDTIKPLTPCELIMRKNIIATGLQNVNGVLHPITSILSTAWIENEDNSFYFYSDGMSPSVSKLISKLDAERLSIAKALGHDLKDVVKLSNDAYDFDFKLINDFAVNSQCHNRIKGPELVNNRYLTEDIPYSVVPWICLADKIGVPTPMLKLTVNLASELLDTNLKIRENEFRNLNLNEW
ncbi:MAG: hypothetical protein GY750_15230 [Lentisphaerae bacterium]|nr:hypothetical protein [Lentisphaerota bacterium]MCP4102750.1 hypothetical protein [Lentisphaerota bacterium]